MSAIDKTVKDKEMASRLKRQNKDHPGSVPNSVNPGWKGEGWEYRKMAQGMTPGPVDNARWQRGMLGGVLAWRLGLSKMNPLG